MRRSRNDSVYEDTKLYRNARDGVIAGVCAGLADYLEIDARFIRIVAVIFLFFSFPIPVFIYIAAVFLIDKRSAPAVRSKSPREEYSGLVKRYNQLENRLREIEKYMTSQQYELNKQLKQL